MMLTRWLFLLLLMANDRLVCASSPAMIQQWEKGVEQLSALPEAVERSLAVRPFAYPYSALLNQLECREGHLLLFAYGSLVDYTSARRHLSHETLSSRRPAIGYGVRRLFDRDVAIHSSSHWGPPWDFRSRGMLNLVYTNCPEDRVTGLLIKVPFHELKSLSQREVGYDLAPIVVSEWKGKLEGAPKRLWGAWTFMAPQQSLYTNSTIHPRPGYYELTRDAFKPYGELFFQLWFLTTYCADGHQPIWSWEQALQRGEPTTQRMTPDR